MSRWRPRSPGCRRCRRRPVAEFVNAGGSATSDVAEWVDEVDPATVVDQSARLHGRGERRGVLPRRPDRDAVRDVRRRRDGRPSTSPCMGSTAARSVSWATTVERITFPQPPSGPAIKPVLSVSLSPRPAMAARTRSVALARAPLGTSPGARQDLTTSSHRRRRTRRSGRTVPEGDLGSLTPPRTNVTPAGLPIGTGTKIEVYDTGVAPRVPGVLPKVTTLASIDNELIDINGDGIVDYPAVGHGLAIGGVIATLAPGATVQEARISDRAGLVTDVSAARRIADSLRNMPRNSWPSVIVNSFGSVACDFEHRPHPAVSSSRSASKRSSRSATDSTRSSPTAWSSSPRPAIRTARTRELSGGVRLGAQRGRTRRHARPQRRAHGRRRHGRDPRPTSRTMATGSRCGRPVWRADEPRDGCGVRGRTWPVLNGMAIGRRHVVRGTVSSPP